MSSPADKRSSDGCAGVRADPSREPLRKGAAGALLLGSGGVLRERHRPERRGHKHSRRHRNAVPSSASGSPAARRPTTSTWPTSTARPEITRDQVFSETVTYLDGRFRLHDDFLCQECKPNASADRWTVRLKPGVEFHNGKTLTADDLLFSVKRLLDPKSGATAAGQLVGHQSLARTTKRDKLTVEFVLWRPSSFFDYLLSDIRLRSPRRLRPQKHPVSTGPWKFKSFRACSPDRARPVSELSRHRRVCRISSSWSGCRTTRHA